MADEKKMLDYYQSLSDHALQNKGYDLVVRLEQSLSSANECYDLGVCSKQRFKEMHDSAWKDFMTECNILDNEKKKRRI